MTDPQADYEDGATWTNIVPYSLRDAFGGIHSLSSWAPPGPFPTIDDFEVVVSWRGTFGLHCIFWSPTLGVLARFPWWDHLEGGNPRGASGDYDWIPVGTVDEPFWDMDEAWSFASWRDAGYVHVLQGGLDDDVYETWFRVPERVFDHAWGTALVRMRAGGTSP